MPAIVQSSERPESPALGACNHLKRQLGTAKKSGHDMRFRGTRGAPLCAPTSYALCCPLQPPACCASRAHWEASRCGSCGCRTQYQSQLTLTACTVCYHSHGIIAELDSSEPLIPRSCLEAQMVILVWTQWRWARDKIWNASSGTKGRPWCWTPQTQGGRDPPPPPPHRGCTLCANPIVSDPKGFPGRSCCVAALAGDTEGVPQSQVPEKLPALCSGPSASARPSPHAIPRCILH